MFELKSMHKELHTFHTDLMKEIGIIRKALSGDGFARREAADKDAVALVVIEQAGRGRRTLGARHNLWSILGHR